MIRSDAIRHQNRRLHRLRELLAVEAPRAGHIPQWFTRRGQAWLVKNGLYPQYGDTLSVVSRLDEIFADGRLFDHFGSAEDGRLLIVEPYPEPRIITGAIRLADALGVAIQISAASFWNPGGTIRIIFRERTSSP